MAQKRQDEKRQTQWKTQQELPIKRNMYETKSSRQIHLKNVETRIKNVSHITQSTLSKEIFHSPMSEESPISKNRSEAKKHYVQQKCLDPKYHRKEAEAKQAKCLNPGYRQLEAKAMQLKCLNPDFKKQETQAKQAKCLKSDYKQEAKVKQFKQFSPDFKQQEAEDKHINCDYKLREAKAKKVKWLKPDYTQKEAEAKKAKCLNPDNKQKELQAMQMKCLNPDYKQEAKAKQVKCLNADFKKWREKLRKPSISTLTSNKKRLKQCKLNTPILITNLTKKKLQTDIGK